MISAPRFGLLEKLPPQARSIANITIVGLAAGLLAVAFHPTIHAINENGIMATSQGSRLHFVFGSWLFAKEHGQ